MDAAIALARRLGLGHRVVGNARLGFGLLNDATRCDVGSDAQPTVHSEVFDDNGQTDT